jgi:hypothetical protein
MASENIDRSRWGTLYMCTCIWMPERITCGACIYVRTAYVCKPTRVLSSTERVTVPLLAIISKYAN